MSHASSRPYDFFVAGGTLRYDAPSYVVRPADSELYHLVQTGSLCYVLTTRQMGKSSLMNRLGRRLQAEGVATALIDLTTIGTASLEEWYVSLLDDLQVQLDLPTDAETWWEQEKLLSPVKRFTKFFRDVVLKELDGHIAIFIDEVDSALKLDFSDDFFAAIRAIYNQTVSSEAAGRFSFVLLGVATPNELIKGQHRTPFNVGERIELEELDLANAQNVFTQGLPAQEPPIIQHVYDWTSGHPYLTQRICQAIARDNRVQWDTDDIDKLIAELFFTERALLEESNLQFVNGRILASPQKEQLLHLYQKIYTQKKPVKNDERDPIQAELKLYGLVKAAPDRHLVVRNRIYHRVFDLSWLKQQQTATWKRLAWIGLILVTIFSIALSIYLWRQAQRSQNLLAQTYISNFMNSTNPTLKLDNLAQLIALEGYNDEALSLFNSLSTAEQIALFTNVTTDLQPQIESVIKTVYTTQVAETITADAVSTQLLTAMVTALRQLGRLENPTILPEIESWLQARADVLQNDLTAAQLDYSVALSLNADNPATRYERALVELALPDNEAALSDLTALLNKGMAWQNRVQATLFQHPQLYELVTTDNSPFAELVALVPTPTTVNVTPTELSVSIPTVPESEFATLVTTAPAGTLPPQIDEEATAVFIDTPLSVPQTVPNGRIIYTCFVDSVDQICTIEADGANLQQITFTDTTNWTASFTPNLTKILFSSSRSGTFALYEADTFGEDVRLLLTSQQGDYAPVAAPNDKQIAFTHAENGNQNIWIMDRDGSNVRPLTTINGDALGATWSPDSQQIAYSQRLADEADYTLVIVNVNSTDAHELALPLAGIGGRSDWSPDGQWLAFYAGPTNDHDIYLVAADGSSYHRITNGGDNLSPSFSPDGNWLVFTSGRDGDNDLYLIRLDGTGLTLLTTNNSSDWQPQWGR